MGPGLKISVEVCDYLVHMVGMVSNSVGVMVGEGWVGWSRVVFVEDGLVCFLFGYP